MDVGAFSDDNFEVKGWINKTFKSTEAQSNEVAFVSSLVMKLQLYVQQVNAALIENSQQVIQSLPRVMRDTELLQQEALLLQDKMQSVKQEIAKVEKDSGESMAALERIDRIKTSLHMAEQALHEADNWTVLATAMEEVFESGDVETISSKLLSMQQSLEILANAPDFEDKKLQLEGYKNRLEAMASPLLVQAFTSGSVERSQVFVRIFMAIERLPQLLKYYHKCQKGALLQRWRALVESDQDEGLEHILRKFYDEVLSNWSSQVKWSGLVFGSNCALATLLETQADMLTSLEPSLSECIDAALKQTSDPLDFLAELKGVTQQFARSLDTALLAASQGKSMPREDLIMSLARAVFDPYIVHVARYGQLESTRLSAQLSALTGTDEDLMDAVQRLAQTVPRAVDAANEAAQRCAKFTEGCGYCGLVRAVNIFFGSYLDQYRIVLRKLNQQKGDAEDWNMFQMCLTLLQTVGVLMTELKELDKEMSHGLTEVWRGLDAATKVKGGNAFKQYKILLLTAKGRNELQVLANSVQEGEDTSLIPSLMTAVSKLCRDVHHTTYQAIFGPISAQLDLVQSAPAWAANRTGPAISADLPDFSFTPQEYITQIGQYLMTLPQHLEPFLLTDNPSLTLALTMADNEYEGRLDGGFADVLLSIIARGTCQTYCENILGIMELSPGACKQLATDIDYLGNVLEDLGLSLSEYLKQVGMLLRLTPEEYQSKSAGCAPRMVAAVRQMRNIPSLG